MVAGATGAKVTRGVGCAGVPCGTGGTGGDEIPGSGVEEVGSCGFLGQQGQVAEVRMFSMGLLFSL